LKEQVETLIRQGKLQKYIRKTEPYRYQWKDDQDRTPEVRDIKPSAGEIKTISGGLTAGETLKSLKKNTRERNKQRPFAAPSNEDAKE